MKKAWALLGLTWLLVGPLIADPLLEKNDPVIGTVNGNQVRLSQVEDKEINDLRLQLYQALTSKLKERTLAELTANNPAYQGQPSLDISEKLAKEFYDKQGLKARGSFEQLKPQIIQYLMSQKMRDHFEELYARALKERKAQNYLNEPAPFLVTAEVATAYLWGNPKSGVMLLEFSDYQCPFCSRVQPSLTELRGEYKKKVLFGYRHFPLEFHTEADEAAIAVECAREQGKFEPYHHLLFSNQKALQIKDLKAYAKQAGVSNQKSFDSCLDQEKYRGQVNQDMRAAGAIGIRGTPSFVVGRYDTKTGNVKGEMFSGALPKEQIAALLDKYLAQ